MKKNLKAAFHFGQNQANREKKVDNFAVKKKLRGKKNDHPVANHEEKPTANPSYQNEDNEYAQGYFIIKTKKERKNYRFKPLG